MTKEVGMVISYGGGSGLGRIGGGGLKASGGEVVASHDEPLVCSFEHADEHPLLKVS